MVIFVKFLYPVVFFGREPYALVKKLMLGTKLALSRCEGLARSKATDLLFFAPQFTESTRYFMQPIDRAILKDTTRRLVRNKAEKRRTGRYPLDMLILYVTMRCNARCDHCFCWEDLNVGIREMTLEEIESLADSVPPMRQLLLTGGEPTLRRDLLEVARAFAKRGKTEMVRINTNGLKPDKLIELAQAFKSEFPGVGMDFQLSLDGLEETHDRIRGVPGNFKKVIESLQKLYALRTELSAFSSHVLTVITEQNYRELLPLNDLLRSEVAPDVVQGFELVRDVETTAWLIPQEVSEKGVGPKAMALPPREAFPQIAADLKTINARGPFRANAFHVHNLAQLRMVETGKEQYKCVTAGSAVGVVYSNGDVAHCEFTLPFANLAEFDYDFNVLWNSDAANERRRQISKCYCIHGCFHGKAVEYSWKGIAEMAKAAMK